MKRTFALFIIPLLAVLLASCSTPAVEKAPPIIVPEPPSLPTKPQYEPPPTAPEEHDLAVQVQMEIVQADFLPNEIRAKKGQTVRLIITSRDKDHTFMLPSYGIAEKLPLGQDIIIEFTPDKEGQFTFYSEELGERETGMEGRLIIS